MSNPTAYGLDNVILLAETVKQSGLKTVNSYLFFSVLPAFVSASIASFILVKLCNINCITWTDFGTCVVRNGFDYCMIGVYAEDLEEKDIFI